MLTIFHACPLPFATVVDHKQWPQANDVLVSWIVEENMTMDNKCFVYFTSFDVLI